MTTNDAPSNRRILVVDDNVSIHEDFRGVLCARPASKPDMLESETVLFGKSSGEVLSPCLFEVDSAFQGKDGLQMVRRAVADGRPYALAFVDIRMPPGWDGVETVKQMWQTCPDLQVVICSAFSDYSWSGIIKNLGEADNLVILRKPFDNVEVLQLAHALTRKWLLNQQVTSKFVDLDNMVNSRTQELCAANIRLEREIAERRLAEEALRLSEARFSKAFHSNPLPMLIYSLRDGRCLDVNARFLAMLECKPPDIVGRQFPEPETIVDERQWAAIRDQLLQSHSARDRECSFSARSGARRDTVLWAERVDVTDEPCVLLIAEDVTERRDLESQLHHAQKMEAVGQLASGVAHDFNNILTVIQGHIELLLSSGKTDPKTTKSLKQVAIASSRAAGLTRQLLTFSRKQAVQPRVLNLNDQVSTLKEMLGRFIGEHVHLQCQCAANLPPVFADPSNIEQIIMNLAVNARDAMPRGGTLSITTAAVQMDKVHLRRQPEARPGEHICLCVRDTGCGIQPEVLPRIFEPFFTTKEVGKGTGLGLATVYGIVKQLNGWIEVISAPGEGAEFKIYLPVWERQPESPSASEPAPEQSRLAHATILVVEDEDSLRELTCQAIRDAGFETIAAADGVEALKIWSDSHADIDLLFTDIVMPNGISGRELAGKLRATKHDLKVLFTSGYSNELVGEGSLLSEGNKFLPKPFTLTSLVHALRECLSLPNPDTSSLLTSAATAA